MGTTNKFPKSVTYLLPQAPEFEANVIGENPNKEVKISSEDYVDNKVNEEVNNVETELTNKINNLSLSTNTTNIAAYQPGAKNINITSINITQQDESQTNLMLFQTTLSYPNQTFSFSTGHIYIKYVESSSSHMIPIILFCYESGSRGTYMQSKVICLTSQLYTGDLMSKGS